MSLVSVSDVPSVTIEPSELAAAAESLRRSAVAATESSERVATTWNALPVSYDAPEAGELLSRMSVVARAADDFAETTGRIATIMADLADRLALTFGRRSSLCAEIHSFRDAVRRFRASSDDGGRGDTADIWGPGQFLQNQALLDECMAMRTSRDTAVEEARSDLSSIGHPHVLLPPAQDSTPARSAAAWAAEYDAVADDVGLAILEKLSTGSPDDARALLAAHDDWRRLLASNPPDASVVNEWWTRHAGTDPHGRDALVLGASIVIGSLGGVPPASRVAANAVNAKNQLFAVDAEIHRLGNAARDGEAAAAIADRRAAIERLLRQRDYLQRAARGDVQLYLYEPGTQSIIEMIGTLDANTTDVITYVPGTFTSVHSFYADEVQQVGRWLRNADPRIVSFAWKEGIFPGEDAMTGGVNPTRLLEANDEGAALDKGLAIAGFQRELLVSSPEASSAQQDGMGHSWGLAAIAASEVAGARYTQVHSLAGAGMPSGWKPYAGTEYLHWGYTDALSIGQGTGAVWSGRVPTQDPAFAAHVYGREGDFQLFLPSGAGSGRVVVSPQPPASVPLTTSPLRNHNLIASDDPGNQVALNGMLRKVQ